MLAQHFFWGFNLNALALREPIRYSAKILQVRVPISANRGRDQYRPQTVVKSQCGPQTCGFCEWYRWSSGLVRCGVMRYLASVTNMLWVPALAGATSSLMDDHHPGFSGKPLPHNTHTSVLNQLNPFSQ